MQLQIKRLHILIGIACVLTAGLFRVYYGGGIGIKLAAKNSFSFSDTIVNLDDIIGMPRLAVAIKHPAVKMQLEEMGIIESDAIVEIKSRKKIEAEIEKQTNEYKQIMDKAMQSVKY